MALRPERLSRILASNRGGGGPAPQSLAGLMHRAGFLRRMNDRVRAALPDTLAPHVQVSNLRDGRLVMIADNAAWGTRLRYFRAVILKAAADAGGADAVKLEIRVNPRERMAPPPRRPQPISADAGRDIAASAEHIDDPELAAALRRLAGRAKGGA